MSVTSRLEMDKSKPGTTEFTRGRAVGLLEGFEDEVLFAAVYANASVGDGKFDDDFSFRSQTTLCLGEDPAP